MKNRKINFIKLGIFLLGISLFLFNCNQEEIEILSQEKVIQKKGNFKTVSLAKAKAYMNNYKKTKKTSLFARGNSFSFEPKWETGEQDSLNFTEALLTDFDIKANIELIEDTKLFFLEINDSIVSAIKTNIIRDRDENGNFKKGEIFFHSLDGNFIDAYTIVEGRLSKRLKPKPQIQQASFFPFQSGCDVTLEQLIQLAIENDGYLSFNEITITASGGAGGAGGPGGGGGGGEGGGANGNPDDGSIGAFAYNNIPNCTANTILVDGVCVPKCEGGKVRNATTNQCECPQGKVEDSSGNCVEKPCEGDPVPNPQIVSSGLSGRKGGSFGCTRSNPNRTCGGIRGKKNHDGIDIKAEVNTSTFSIYKGKVSSLRDTFSAGEYKKNSFGNYIIIKSTVNGKTIYIRYNHLNKVSVKKDDFISVGQIIGLNGNTGNSAAKGVTSHIHIQAFDSSWKSINPADYLKTKFDSEYKPIINNCN
jgi:hypothetical protein